VFVNRKRDAETVANYIEREVAGVRAEALHGDLMQGRRDRVRDNVKTGRAQASTARPRTSHAVSRAEQRR